MLTASELRLYSSLKQKKNRDKEGKFLIEGSHLLNECLNSDYKLDCVIISEDRALKKTDEIFDKVSKKKIPIHFIKKHQFRKLSETENTQGILAVIKKINEKKLDLKSLKLIVALDRISDPGNLGTIIRTSYWFRVDAILLSKYSVDIYNSKVIRSTQGAIFHMNIYEDRDLIKDFEKFDLNGFEVLLFTPVAETDIINFTFSNKSILVFGNESEGITEDLLKLHFKKVKIKNYSNCESLNVAVSCGIALNSVKIKSDILKL